MCATTDTWCSNSNIVKFLLPALSLSCYVDLLCRPLDSPKPPASAAAIAATVVIVSTVILIALASVVEANPGDTVSLIVKKPPGVQGELPPPQDNPTGAQDAIGEVNGRFDFCLSVVCSYPPPSNDTARFNNFQSCVPRGISRRSPTRKKMPSSRSVRSALCSRKGPREAGSAVAEENLLGQTPPDQSTALAEEPRSHGGEANNGQNAPDVTDTRDMVATDAPPSGGGSGGGDKEVVLVVAWAGLSIRRPSSALVWLIVAQAQFLATLSLVDSVGLERSWLAAFLRYLR